MIFLSKVKATIDWEPVTDMLIKFYETGKVKERSLYTIQVFRSFFMFNPEYYISAVDYKAKKLTDKQDWIFSNNRIGKNQHRASKTD